MSRLILVHSPFVGPSAWQATAAHLPDALAPDCAARGPDWYEDLAGRVAAAAGDGAWVAVLHSGAGGFAPSLAAASPSLAGFVFLDAILPHPGKSAIHNAPPEFAARLREVTVDGRLAPWNRWFDADPTERMIPDPAARAAFVADLPRTPFAFLEAVAPEHAAWEALPAAYVQLSRTYDSAAERAEARGWTVRRERSHHLAMASDPAWVAGLLSEVCPA